MYKLLRVGGSFLKSMWYYSVSQVSSSFKASNFLKSDLFCFTDISFLILWGKIFQFGQLSLL